MSESIESGPAEGENPPRPPGEAAELPPVEPPSMGFIVQLFVIPALIVVAIVGVWALFGRLASGRLDVDEVLANLRSQNAHRRWRAAHNLTQLLQADVRSEADGTRLAEDPRVASELAGMLDESLEHPARQPKVRLEQLQQQAFLARGLGWFDVPDVVLPVLRRAALTAHGPPSGDAGESEDELGLEVRKSALTSIALIAGRAFEKDRPLSQPELVNDLVTLAADEQEAIRQLATYCLGLLPGDESLGRLKEALLDADDLTRVNAAVALARNGSSEGLDVFEELLREELQRPAGSTGGEPPVRQQWFTETAWPPVILCVVAVMVLMSVWAVRPRRWMLAVSGLLVAASVAIVVVERNVVTEHEQVNPSGAGATADSGPTATGGAVDRPTDAAPPAVPASEVDARADFARETAVAAALRAVADLADALEPEARQRLRDLIEPIADRHANPALRVAAREAMVRLDKPR